MINTKALPPLHQLRAQAHVGAPGSASGKQPADHPPDDTPDAKRQQIAPSPPCPQDIVDKIIRAARLASERMGPAALCCPDGNFMIYKQVDAKGDPVAHTWVFVDTRYDDGRKVTVESNSIFSNSMYPEVQDGAAEMLKNLMKMKLREHVEALYTSTEGQQDQDRYAVMKNARARFYLCLPPYLRREDEDMHTTVAPWVDVALQGYHPVLGTTYLQQQVELELKQIAAQIVHDQLPSVSRDPRD